MIISRLYGGLGNQMFQYAIGRALSIKNNIPLGLDLRNLLDRTPRKGFTFRDFDLELFAIKAETLSQSKIPFWYRHFGEGKFAWYLNKTKNLFLKKGIEKTTFSFDETIANTKGGIYLSGYWQHPKYFQDIQSVLKEDFSLKNPLPENIAVLKQEVESRNSLCVHVRRGDYVGNKNHDILPSDYYEKSLEKFTAINIEHIYVFSDDIEWCKENMSFEMPVTFVGDEYAGESATGHFELMRACKHFIIPNSTFSWWAAYLAGSYDKIVVVPNGWIDCTTLDNWITL